MKSRLGRFISNSMGSSFLRPLRRSRHRSSQMKAMSRGRFSGRGARFGI